MSEADQNRRFSGVSRLYGEIGAKRLQQAHVCVVGIGGVGSWTAEALARTAVGNITLIDLDMVAESNTNRQIHALDEIYGKAKVDAMADRIRAINPECKITCIEDFVTLENLENLLSNQYSVVIDAIDQSRIKAAMIAFCHRRKRSIIVAGAAGGKTDPTQVRIADLSQTVQDPLLSRVRSILRKEHGFSKQMKKRFGISAAFSTEQVSRPPMSSNCAVTAGPTGLNCAGYGSSVCVTSTIGMAVAAEAIRQIISSP